MDTKTPRLVLKLLLVGLGALAVHCDDPVPPEAEGAVAYYLNYQPGKPACLSPKGSQNIDNVSAITSTPAVNGPDISVSCRVIPQGAGFLFEGHLRQGENKFDISGTLTPGQPSTAIVNVADEDLKASFSSNADNPCTVSVDNTDTSKLAVAAGKIWAKFDCPDLIQAGADTTAPHCALAGRDSNEPGGYLLFQNCEQ